MQIVSRILTFGHDATLLKTREMLLSRDGFDVVSATEPNEAARVLAHQHIDLLILCHTLREQERQSMLTLAHGSEHEMKTLVLLAGASSFIDAGLDATLCTIDGPGSLLATVHGLTDRHILPPTTAAS